MPHMMPMMWSFTLISSMIMFLITLMMIYFFYLPNPSSLNTPLSLKYYKNKWTWKW